MDSFGLGEVCSVEDRRFYEFMREIELFIAEGDIDVLLDRADLKDCYEERKAFMGFDRETDCPPDDSCLYCGISQG